MALHEKFMTALYRVIRHQPVKVLYKNYKIVVPVCLKSATAELAWSSFRFASLAQPE
jgi:hypothetical protein